MNRILLSAAVALAAIGASAENETMYLVKGDRVVSKFAAGAVDYITFNLPDNVSDEALWLSVDKVGKNSVTYTVNTAGANVAYAHNLLSYYDVNYTAMDMYGDMLENLDEESFLNCLKYTLSTNAFVSIGKSTVTQNDFQQYDPSSEMYRFKITPGTKYYLCAWEVDAATTEPLETFAYTELTTEKPAEVDLNIDVTEGGFNDFGMILNFSGFPNILYVTTCWGMKDQMESYEKVYGRDFLMGTFGQSWSMDFLSGTGDMEPGIENNTWPVYDPGEYIMYVNAYDAEGNVQEKTFVFNYVSSTDEEVPLVNIFSKEKGKRFVKVNFEITPSNVEEAYVRLLDENTVSDRINMGYTYPELAMGGDAIDITNEINNLGEYTFSQSDLDEAWQTLLIYAKAKTGGVTTLRVNFFPDNNSEWDVYAPYHAPALKKIGKIKNIRRAGVPVIKK
ncbi:MAG: hypothetical protein K2M09_09065 [Muribaculaceae bacterium]|nr:hypothetical protein [Muribaculaceae bacterium]